MIARDFRGKDVARIVRYILERRHAPRIVGGNMKEQVPRRLAREFRDIRRLRPDIERPVHHAVLSLAPEDRKLAPEELGEIARRYMEGIGYAGCQFVVVEHRDTAHQHVHIVANRIRPDASVVRNPYWGWEAAMRVVREIEGDLGLRPVTRDRYEGARQPTSGEYRMARENGRPSSRMQLQALVGEAWQRQAGLTEFVKHLGEAGVEVRFYRDAQGEVSGISYKLDRQAFGGFALGPSYTWKGIQRHGVSYDPVRDQSAVDSRYGGQRETPAGRRRARVRRALNLEVLRPLVRGAAEGQPTFTDFVRRLGALGVGVRLDVAQTGKVSGMTYRFDDGAFKGSELGRDFSWKGIQRAGVSYDPARDQAAAKGKGVTDGGRSDRSLHRASREAAEGVPRLDGPGHSLLQGRQEAARERAGAPGDRRPRDAGRDGLGADSLARRPEGAEGRRAAASSDDRPAARTHQERKPDLRDRGVAPGRDRSVRGPEPATPSAIPQVAGGRSPKRAPARPDSRETSRRGRSKEAPSLPRAERAVAVLAERAASMAERAAPANPKIAEAVARLRSFARSRGVEAAKDVPKAPGNLMRRGL